MKSKLFLLIFIALSQWHCAKKSENNNTTISAKPEKALPVILQKGVTDCGPVCLEMVAKYHNIECNLERLKQLSKVNEEGTSMKGLSEAADSIGLTNFGVQANFEQLQSEFPLPAIAYWNNAHFIVVYQVDADKVMAIDPAVGKVQFNKADFCTSWYTSALDDSKEKSKGLLLLLDKKEDVKNRAEGK